VLGVDGGATSTQAILVDASGCECGRAALGPANPRLLSDGELDVWLRGLAGVFPRIDAVAMGLAGIWEPRDRERVERVAARFWPGVPCRVTHDLAIALAAAPALARPGPEVLVLSGTGACCFGRNPAGGSARIGGWGHLLGDQGSGYDLGLGALRAVVEAYDHTGRWPRLGADLLHAVQLNEPHELIGWGQNAAKAEVASLAVVVLRARARRDPLAARLVAAVVRRLAVDGAACARKVTVGGAAPRFVLAGGLLQGAPALAASVARELRREWPGSAVVVLDREPAWGAAALARGLLGDGSIPLVADLAPGRGTGAPLVRSQGLSPTEERNPLSAGLDRLPVGRAIELMLSEDAALPGRLLACRPEIERVVRLVARALRIGGRLFYVGAGTSGRLGVLDASECPPTFNTEPEQVQGIIAGGATALWSSVEAGEDDDQAGARAVQFRRVDRRDVVVGIAASGTTPFVWGALRAAKATGAATVLVAFNPHLQIPRTLRPQVVIAPSLGPEILTGSTRLKAGTATKLLLNIFTTLAMVRLGKVRSNLMVDVRASNTKLRDRAARITMVLSGAGADAARGALAASGWDVRRALRRLTPGARRRAEENSSGNPPPSPPPSGGDPGVS